MYVCDLSISIHIIFVYPYLWVSLVALYPSGKESARNAGDLGLILELGRFPGERNGYLFSTLAWRIPWTKKPGRLQSMWLQRVGHD